MFNFHNRQYLFRQSVGNLWNFFCDSKQNLCYNTLTKRGMWSNPVVLHKNVYQYFYADMDQEEVFHLLFQDKDGNIQYSRLDGHSLKTVPILIAKIPSIYNKHLYLAPFNKSIHIFYVLQHENSFMLAAQILSGGKISNPRVIDYVSGSSLPCSILFDSSQNIYAFYQSYDGKYLQLGYKKFSFSQKHWSDFIPVTKDSGNCEYPHAMIDGSGIIHLCYQRRAPKLFEMVYQQKAPDKNLWTPEVIVHASIYSFENASILQANGDIVVYWVREDVIYYNTGSQAGNNWSKAVKLNFSGGRPLQCLSYKSNSPRDRVVGTGSFRIGEQSPLLPSGIYPGNLLNGLKLAFNALDNIEDSSPLLSDNGEGRSCLSADNLDKYRPMGDDNKSLMLSSLKQLQGSVDEIREGWSDTKKELAKLTNSYERLNRELGKYTIRLNMLENQLGQSKVPVIRTDEISREPKTQAAKVPVSVNSDNVKNQNAEELTKPAIFKEAKPPQKPTLSLDPDKLKEWEEWKEPKEWQGGSE